MEYKKNMNTEAIEKKAETVAVAAVGGTQQSDNHIYFYDDVTAFRVLQLSQQLREIDHRLRAERVQRDFGGAFPALPIVLHINSFGGELFAGISAYDHIKSIQTPIHTVIEGVACSAATLISIAGNKRYMMANAYLMIHQFSSAIWGSYEQFKDDMKLQDDLIERLRKMYVDNSKLKYAAVKKLLKHNSWFNTEEAKKAGLIDEVISK